VFQAVADVGGVGGPVSGRGTLPGDRDADVDAELAQSFGELVGADGLPGLAAGEQPG
jgi:hypothetical protein